MNSENTNLEKKTGAEAAVCERTRSSRCYRPNVDIVENDEAVILLADLPGTRSEDISVDFEKGTLSLHALVSERQPEGTRFLMREYDIGDYTRTFEVNEQIDASRISAAYANGVLRLTLPKTEIAKPRRIQVSQN